ncbi:MAG: histidine kinase dimerization/phosphoacceptor domain-containing protein [Dehalococcoidia bacterium]|nr:histidine kinase dimerization/phosphoacceptor domain-containing protein [Dehalococcoidia bacterium]
MMTANYGYLAYELRDGVLQDMVAIGLLIEAARTALRSGAPSNDVEAILDRAQQATRRDLGELRSMIDRLKPAA